MSASPLKKVPKHVAFIMDGNGRWAQERGLPRTKGHQAGAKVLEHLLRIAHEEGIEIVSFFAFSSENWQRPKQEVDYLMRLFLNGLKKQVKTFHEKQIQLRVIGDTSRFSKKIQQGIIEAETLTRENQGLKVIFALNYGGQWDIVQAVRGIAEKVEQGSLTSDAIDATTVASHLSLAGLPDPDLFIRTSGEQRLSNFFLWQLAYTELYFTPIYWPEFSTEEFKKALEAFARRGRCFGKTREQVKSDAS